VQTGRGALALYRNTASYPEPYRSDFRTLIRDYARTTIDDAWPKQRRGSFRSPATPTLWSGSIIA
jgi:hypothetical protein